MKKNLFILAVAAFALASCSNDDTVAENVSFNESNAISFRTSVNGVTRAADQSASTLQTNGFYVTARQNPTSGEASTYFDNVWFKYTSGTYNSETKYYWPSDGTLDFFAYAPATDAQLNRTNYTTFTVTPATTAATQVDFLYANTDGKTKAGPYKTETYGSLGVPLNFRHAESKIIIKLKNTNANLTFTVGDVAIGNVKGSGVFTYADASNTDAHNDGNLTTAEWNVASASNATYTQTVTSGSAYSTSSEAQAGVDLILIPQALSVATAYANEGTAAVNDPFNGAFITVQIKVQNTNNNAYVVGGADTFVTAMWPLTALTWTPGYAYTYTVDLAGGGYYTTNQDTNEDLDPILENAVIKFVDVTVDEWDAATGTVYTEGL